ncbi:tRNA dimethylallyltransferase, mitochondrial [Coemansia brasiliensis]|uniref:tRNA dimethylallyltransferase n=1 Tax=Coemansia brasiliensis TaxID=2650707 RepID=A0A9W8M2V2_9FUNG|nr:tRNA dimethylallyltransferase, mitochondrial [Coemansia brasiliensis]
MSVFRKGVIAIVGTTGVGKSQLAIELARAINGEVINADALQMYTGYDIITNKVTKEEQSSIPHHLLGTVSANHEYTVQEYEQEALAKISEIHQRQRTPILVGGTNYYVQSVLFRKSLIPTEDSEAHTSPKEFEKQYEAKSNIDVWEELRRNDREMAEIWHPNNRRKVLRSLQVFYTTGKKHSEWIRETQEARQNEETLRFPALVLWLYAEKEQLDLRLDKRVDKMMERGLLREVEQLQYDTKGNGFTTGLRQAIGFRELTEAVKSPNDESLLKDGVERMKTATRQYARRQVAWLRNKMVPTCRDTQSKQTTAHMFVLNATNVDQSAWDKNVRSVGIDLAQKFVCDNSLPNPQSLSQEAAQVLTMARQQAVSALAWQRHLCEVCSTSEQPVWIHGADELRQHRQSRRHRRNAQRHSKK